MRRWLIKLRKEQRLTQQQIAAGAHIDRAYYAQIENGTRNPSMAVASQIASFLHINPSLFYTEHLSEPFETALVHSPITVAHCDLDLRYTWMYNPHPDFKMNSVIGKRDDELDDNVGTTELMQLKSKVIEEGQSIRKTIPFPLSEGLIRYDVFCQPIFDSHGRIIGAATASTALPS
ncbi:helix-turn-helix domain-containing protein [Halobacillus sp. ACCC02827]|uniref:helix-turn-helix domain-containing protein n=1 Tax=Bacillaceae TaxID=186817 RepID=UPI0002A4FD52|nr:MULTISPECIES: helix-turn-helix domain-containing protein [Bacillaceae]ELK48193.1 two-component hybrid sensor and regulator [Halobacillus sp. BAB-2008]QHT48301.1 helix-turn-helix domain-containing protein [Bacillus sp. SB49]WJE15539.1 helix-turn-helix domain-containing protein [Halobacillus sp. ACCC02827]